MRPHRADSLENELLVEGQFATEEQMKDEWGFSAPLVSQCCNLLTAEFSDHGDQSGLPEEPTGTDEEGRCSISSNLLSYPLSPSFLTATCRVDRYEGKTLWWVELCVKTNKRKLACKKKTSFVP